MKTLLHVLSIGTIDESNTVRDALLARQRCSLSIITKWLDLCLLPKEKIFDVAILHPTLRASELQSACEYIRRRWPQAKILVIRSNAEDLENRLCDSWAGSALSGIRLLIRIEKIANSVPP